MAGDVGAQARALGDDGGVDVDDAVAARRDQADDASQQLAAVDARRGRVAGREVLADVAPRPPRRAAHR